VVLLARDKDHLDSKFDLLSDFSIKLSGAVNDDNLPAIGAMDPEYVLKSGFRWKWQWKEGPC
jgi:hypothetical protein